MEEGKQVVTANKALLAEQGEAVYRQAAHYSRQVGIEASVCGGIPIVQAMREGLASNNVTHFLGIVNGTCNYILSSMSQRGVGFAQALKEAQAKGYAEANPALDVDGVDSAHKLAILARLAFRSDIDFKRIPTEGIRHLSAADIAYAAELGYVIKLLAIGKKMKGGVELRVHPTLLPLDHPLATVRGVYNAVFVQSDQAGDQLFYGRGAGQLPTASAVMSDIIDISKKIATHSAYRSAEAKRFRRLKVLPVERSVSRYYLRFQAADKPGVLGRIAQTLGDNGISILSVHQKESHNPGSAPVVILTYAASEKSIRKALRAIDARGEIRERTRVIRVEG
jgi:homoserine dehydrogenase